jgi:hypothetical protein
MRQQEYEEQIGDVSKQNVSLLHLWKLLYIRK